MFRFDGLRTSLFLVIVVGAGVPFASADDPPPEDSPEQPAEEQPAEQQPPTEALPTEVEEVKPTGTVTGRAIDTTTKEGLPAATLIIKGPDGNQSLATELDGTFTVQLPPGKYSITVSTPYYIDQTKTLVIEVDKTARLDVALAMIPAKTTEETIEVYDTIDKNKSSAVLAERRFAVTVSDAISAEQISRSPDSNASDAAKRMVAATIQDNRYIVVRGLSGRYSTTLLNGVPLPSPDPDVPAAPLDLFPASLITNLTINKTFAPDMPGNFAGGALGIETRTYPTKFAFKGKLGIANNTLSSFRELNGQQGGSLDALGFDDGTRGLPDVIPDDQLAGDSSLTTEQRNAQIAAFKNTWGVRRGRVGPNLSVGATLGNTHKIEEHRLGYFGSLSFGHGHANRLVHLERPGGSDGMGGRLPSVLQLDDQQGIENAMLSGIASAGWVPQTGHKIDLFTLYSHGTDITSSQVIGTENNSSIIDRTRLQFLQRELVFGQLIGEHKLSPLAILEWQGNVAQVAQHEPDTKDLLRTQTPTGMYAISTSPGSSERLFGELADTTVGGGAAVRVPLDEIKLKVGASVQHSARDYQQRRFHFSLLGDAVYLPPEEAFSPEQAGLAMEMYESTLPTDGYMATRLVGAAFVMGDVNITDKLRAIGGVRVEHSNLDVGLESKIDLMSPPSERTTHTNNVALPSLNAVYAVTPSSNLRAAYGLTVARPNFREIAPALYYDYVRRRAIGGNPNLAETRVHNGDVRWETFIGDNEVLAASVFAKYFRDPIERTVESAGDGDNIGFANSPNAMSYGVELEARVSLGRLVAALDEFSVGGNLSLIQSRINSGTAMRPLQGQSPYVANIGVGYESKQLGTRVDVLCNSFGRRIEEVGTAGVGNVYEEPIHRLDLAASHPLRNFRVKLSGGNLLDQRVVRTQDGVEIYAYKPGVTVVGGIEVSLD